MDLNDVYQSVKDGDDDTELNIVIQQFLTDQGLSDTVSQWRLANYKDLRKWAYPDQADFMNSYINRMILEEDDEEFVPPHSTEYDTYTAEIIAYGELFYNVNVRFPKV